MRIVSWNVWWRFGDHWGERQGAIVETLAALQADVIGLQETWASQTESLGERLGMHHAFEAPSLPPAPESDSEIGVTVLSRWPILHTRPHRLPSAHREDPVGLHAAIDHPVGPMHVFNSCVEWEPNYFDDHLAQTKELAHLLSDPALDGPLPVVFTADLNASPESPQMMPVNEVMIDAWIAGGGDDQTPTLTSDNPFAPREAIAQIDRRIDYVMIRPGTLGAPEVSRVFMAGEPIDGLYPSDHYAVVADLAL